MDGRELFEAMGEWAADGTVSVHWETHEGEGRPGLYHTACGQYLAERGRVTRVPGMVTCRNCARVIEGRPYARRYD